jgi:Sulfotransferase family
MNNTAPKVASATTSERERPAPTNDDFEPVFIVGHPRSGTTMLARIFDRHPQMAVPAETHFFLPSFRDRLRAAQQAGTHGALLDYLRGISATDSYSEESVTARFIAGPPTPFDLFRCLLQDYAAYCGKPRCGEKTPWHMVVVPRLLAAYPRSRAICLIRDGRDVVRSALSLCDRDRQPKWYPSRVATCWCRIARLAEKYRRRYPDRFVICRFEALLENPATEMRRLDEFAGISFEPEQLLGERRDTVKLPRGWDQLPTYWDDRVSRAPDLGRAYAWRQSSDTREIQYLTALMNPYLVRFGYDSYWSSSVAGHRGNYYGYRAMASLVRVLQLSSRLTGAVGRSVHRPPPGQAVVDGLAQTRSREAGHEDSSTAVVMVKGC